MAKKYTLEAFQDFLSNNCFDLDKYAEGLCDRKIYDWFKRKWKADDKKPNNKKIIN